MFFVDEDDDDDDVDDGDDDDDDNECALEADVLLRGEIRRKKNSISSGKRHLEKGFMYYSESYMCIPFAVLLADGANSGKVLKVCCPCTTGQSGSCGHVVGLLYHLANYKILGRQSVPVDAAQTSLPQTWHIPRGDKIRGHTVHSLQVRGQTRKEESRVLLSVSLSALSVTQDESTEIELSTRLQPSEPKWYTLRRHRVTASHAGNIFKMHGVFSFFVLDNERVAARAYSTLKNKEINIYPCGVTVNPHCYWLAAS
ncbi:uncharacterized protein [Haliotis cracherodii]|uniref:uncharacterized protein n=1 Tax=Haliotis cracherodii TaxID=6455 RepID=UPI0039E80363